MKKKKIIIIVVTAVVFMIAVPFFADWYKFYSVDKSIKTVVSEIQKQYGLDNVTVEKYCTYGHQKFSRGSLSCDVRYSFELKNVDLENDISNKIKKIGWANKLDVTDSINKYSNVKYTKYETYDYESAECFHNRVERGMSVSHILQCGGQALREWYPVRK